MYFQHHVMYIHVLIHEGMSCCGVWGMPWDITLIIPFKASAKSVLNSPKGVLIRIRYTFFLPSGPDGSKGVAREQSEPAQVTLPEEMKYVRGQRLLLRMLRKRSALRRKLLAREVEGGGRECHMTVT